MAEIIAVFDLEGTLCQSGKLIWHKMVKLRSGQASGIFRVVPHVLHQILISSLLKRKLIGEYKARMRAMESMAFLMGGLKVAEVEKLAEIIAPEVIATVRPDIKKLLDAHLEQSHRVILTSGQFQPFLAAIGKKLNVNSVLGTGLEIRGATYTGRVIDAVCFGEHRVSRIKDYIEKNGLEVDFTKSYAYGDMKWDCPVLELVGNPVAVYPDTDLRAYAQSKDWKIIS